MMDFWICVRTCEGVEKENLGLYWYGWRAVVSCCWILPAPFLQPHDFAAATLLHVMASATPQACGDTADCGSKAECGSATFTYLMSEIVLVMMSSSVSKPLFLGAYCIEL